MDRTVSQKLTSFFGYYSLDTYPPGSHLITAYDTPKGIFYLEKGLVTQYSVSSDGEESSLNTYKPGTFFPMTHAFTNHANKYTFKALEEVHVRVAPPDSVIVFLKENPDVLFDLTKRLFVGLDGLLDRVEQLTTGKAQDKILITLIIMAKRFGKLHENTIVIPQKYTHQDLGGHVGLSRETVSREMMKLKKQQLITYTKNAITIFDLNKLEALLAKG